MKVLRLRLVVLVLAGATVPLRAQETPTGAPDPGVREVQAAQDQLARAIAEFDGPNQSRSIVLFDDIIGRLEGVQRQSGLPVRGRDILVQAYELRARAYFNLGLQEKASADFRQLVQIKPDYALSKDKVSPKVIDVFNLVKKSLVGYLAVSSKPAGAKVTLVAGGDRKADLGLTDFFPLEVLAGDYTVEVAKEGYKSETRTVSIAPRATEALEVELVRTLASTFFITEPAGVEVFVDGELRLTTAGTLAPDFFELARGKGLEPSRASARTEIGNLSLGSHIIELRRRCYETVRRTIDTSAAQDYDIDPIKMEDSQGSLRLTSDPPGGKIFLNGEAKGLTPAEIESVCSGRIHLEVKHTAGKFIKDFTLGKDEAVTLDCPIRPSLAFLGSVADTPAGERVLADADEKIRENLQKITSLNFIVPPRESVDRVLDSEKVTRKALVAGSGVDPDVVRKVTEKLAAALEVQGFLVAVLPEERLQHTAVLYLLAAGNAVAEPGEVTFGEAASYLRFVSKIDHQATVYRPWSGLITVDTLLQEGLPVLRAVPGSPAAQAGIQPGEVVTGADGKAIKATAAVLALVEQKKPKDRLSVDIKGASGSRTVELTLSQTPQEIPLFEPTLLYNKVMMDLRQQVEGYPGTESAAYAWLNLALCAMHFQDFATAHNHLTKAKAELPQRPGISQGTALYYMGVALDRLSYRPQAIEAFKAAAAFKDATLFNNDGPSVAPLAARRSAP
jgi:tetratricopeptide (TPR) repeat protein